jgi:hypothetical protein
MEEVGAQTVLSVCTELSCDDERRGRGKEEGRIEALLVALGWTFWFGPALWCVAFSHTLQCSVGSHPHLQYTVINRRTVLVVKRCPVQLIKTLEVRATFIAVQCVINFRLHFRVVVCTEL